jgi:hypothetical protein
VPLPSSPGCRRRTIPLHKTARFPFVPFFNPPIPYDTNSTPNHLFFHHTNKMSASTVNVSNISGSTTDGEIRDFFSFW